MSDERADVVVIGSGAAGAALTWRLAELGTTVVCLEQGDWVKPEDYPSLRADYETQVRRGNFSFSPNLRRRPEDYPVMTSGLKPEEIAMFNGVGGGTVHWEAHFPRFHPSDFRVRSLDGVAADWPIGYHDLEPYYEMNDQQVGVSGLNGDPANPPRSPRPTPPLPIGRVGQAVARGFDRLGWHWWVADLAMISNNYDGRSACDLRGRCNFGCPVGAKASMDKTYWPKALRRGAMLKTWARVREITVDAQGRAQGVLYYDRQGNLHEQLGRVVVVCGNGIGTPRLLLNSKSKLFPQGLANSSGLVGKSLMIHPARLVEGIFDEPLDGHFGPSTSFAFSQQFYETEKDRGFVRGYTMLVYRTLGPLSHAWGSSEPVPWGDAHHGVMRRRFPHTALIVLLSEDLPEEANRVELDSVAKDSSGVPAPRVTYHYSENTRRMLAHGAARGRELLEAAGAADILDNGVISPFAHLMGTARMGGDPKRSVVNAWNQAHDVKNLFIVDGSSFTTCSGVNPTSTIGALALRCADGIWDRRREWS